MTAAGRFDRLGYTKRILGKFKSGKLAKTEATEEIEKSVPELRSDVYRSAAIVFLSVLVPVTAWQIKKTHPIIPAMSFTVALMAIERGNKQSNELQKGLERKARRDHLAIQREEQEDVGTFFSHLLPTFIPKNGLRGDIVLTLANYGIDAVCVNEILAPAFVRLQVVLRSSENSVKDVERKQDDLRIAMRCKEAPIIAPQEDCISIDIPRRDRQVCKIDDHLASGFMPAGTPVTLPMGIDIDGKLITATLSDPNTCHFLVGGTTGSGKSEFLKTWVRWLMQWHPDDVQIIIIDPKRVTFTGFEKITKLKQLIFNEETQTHEPIFEEDADVAKYQAWLPFGVIKDDVEGVKAYQWANEEQKRRYKKFEEIGVSNLTEYNNVMREHGGQTMPTIVMITDEYAMLTADPQIKTGTEEYGKQLGAMARAAGICMVLATQRPEVGVVTPIVRSMFPGRLCLKVASEQDSAIVLGGSDDEFIMGRYLLGYGDGYFYGGDKLHRVQGLYWDGVSQPPNPGVVRSNPAVLPELVIPAKGKGNKIASTNEKALPASQTIEVKTEEQRQEEFRQLGEIYSIYRNVREKGDAPDKFFQIYFSKDGEKPNTSYSKDEKIEFYRSIKPFLAHWSVELHEAGVEPAAIVKKIFNVGATPRFKEDFDLYLSLVEKAIARSKEKQEAE